MEDDPKLKALKKQREDARLLHGAQSPQYRKLNQQLWEEQNKAKRTEAKRNKRNLNKSNASSEQLVPSSTTTLRRNFDELKDYYKSLVLAPVVCLKKSYTVYNGIPLRNLMLIPTEADAKAVIPDYDEKPKPRVKESGILDFTPIAATELSNIDKDKIVALVGRGFAFDGVEFECNDARVAWELLNKHPKTTTVVKIEYTYFDSKTDSVTKTDAVTKAVATKADAVATEADAVTKTDSVKKTLMTALAGVVILSDDMTLYKHDKDETKRLNAPSCKVYNMVQFTILPEYGRRGLGLITLDAIESIMVDLGVDFLFWCGCAKRYYEMAGSSRDPVMIKTPFNIEKDDKKDRELFFYMDIVRDRTSKFQQNVVDFYKEDPTNRSFSIEYKSSTLKVYYGLPVADKKENKGVQPLKNDVTKVSINNEYPVYDIAVIGEQEVNISICIKGYHTDNLEYNFTGDLLVVSGTRTCAKEEAEITHKFEIYFKMDPAIVRNEDISGRYDAGHHDSSMVFLTAKTKIVADHY